MVKDAQNHSQCESVTFPLHARPLCCRQVKESESLYVRGISESDFAEALKRVRRSVPAETLEKYEEWNRGFGDITAS